MVSDPRRNTPRTDVVLADPRLRAASDRLGPRMVRGVVAATLARVRAGELPPPDAADAVYYDRVRLGELIAQSMERLRDADGRVLLDGAAPAAESAVTKTPAREEDVLDASFLVRADRRAEFERAVDELARDHAERVKIRLIGPLPPYDFVPEE